ncbi:hypothetical protein JW826_05680 [Candidatus Woesearchaeota archaeon]|nr:hypothetical protein [Candidatus Woesearchaeota archaeon]
MRVRKDAQVSLEFLLVVGFAMLMSLPLIFVFYKQSETLNTEIAGSQVEKVASEIRDAADEVYYLGAPSKKTLTVYMPKNINAISILGSSIAFNVSTPGGIQEIVRWSAANFSSMSTVSTGSGIKHIMVEARTFDVLITDY